MTSLPPSTMGPHPPPSLLCPSPSPLGRKEGTSFPPAPATVGKSYQGPALRTPSRGTTLVYTESSDLFWCQQQPRVTSLQQASGGRWVCECVGTCVEVSVWERVKVCVQMDECAAIQSPWISDAWVISWREPRGDTPIKRQHPWPATSILQLAGHVIPGI